MSTRPLSLLTYEELRDLLEFVDPDTGNFTCVGHAPSKRRRCHNPIAFHNQIAAKRCLLALQQIPTQRNELSSQLEELAQIALCKRNHQSQFREVAARWHRRIVAEFDRLQQPPTVVHTRTSRTNSTPSGEATATTLVVYEEIRRITMLRIVTSRHSSTPSVLTPSTESQAPSFLATPRHTAPGVGTQNGPLQTWIDGVITPPMTPLSPTNSIAERHTVPPSSQTPVTEDDPDISSTPGTEASHQCPICYQQYEDPQQTPCGHVYCRECITTWLHHHHSCPYDRRPLFEHQLVPVREEEEDACAICFECSDDLQVTPCGHIFDDGCISEWLREHNTCPCDRLPLHLGDLIPVARSHRHEDRAATH